MTTIAFVGIPGETSWLCQRLRSSVAGQSPSGTFHCGQLQAHEIIVVQCAIGKVNAAMAMERLLERHAPDLILNIGSAGAITPELGVGDIVIADQIVPYDAGVFLPRGFLTTGHGLPLRPNRHWRVFPCDPGLVSLAEEAAMTMLARPAPGIALQRIRKGPVASGDQVIFSDEPKRWLHRSYGVLAVETEGAAVAQVATAHGVPWLAVRGISDTADHQAAFDYTPLLRYADEPTGLLGWARYRSRYVAYMVGNRRTQAHQRRFAIGVQRVNRNISAFVDALFPLL